tara:strand:- start:693 stop:2231 length:1539 start_codon:yes stop_codon:yes gene_type:complete
MAIDYSDEDFDQDQQQDIAAAAAQAAGINMDSYDFGGFDPGGSDTAGVSNKAAATGILNSYFNDPTRTGMAIRQSFPNFRSPKSGLNQFANLYTSRRGPMSRSDFNSLYDRTALNPGGINTLGYDTVKTLQRLGIGSGQIVNNPNAGRLTGTVFGKKNARGETILSSGGKSMGIDADKYYGGGSGSDIGRPDLETYQDKYGYANPNQRALNRAYDSYINPRNNPDRVGYNRDVPSEYEMQRSAERGQVRPGLRSTAFTDRSGTPTVLGPVATYDRDFSGADNIAMTLAPGGMGFLARALANPVSGIEGQAIPSAALAPTEEMLARGETSGGMMRSFNEALGQGIGALGDAGQGIMNAGTNIGDAFTNAVQNTAEGLVNAGVNTAEAVDAAVRNTIDLFGLDGYSDSKPQVQRQLDDAPLDENMYGSGMFDLGTMAAPLSQSSITGMTPTELFDLNYGLDRNRPIEDVNQNFDRMAEELKQQQRRSREMDRRRDTGTTFNQLPPTDVFNYFTR